MYSCMHFKSIVYLHKWIDGEVQVGREAEANIFKLLEQKAESGYSRLVPCSGLKTCKYVCTDMLVLYIGIVDILCCYFVMI